MWERKLKNALKEIWGPESVEVLAGLTKIPERTVNTETKLREEVRKVEAKFTSKEKAAEVSNDLWSIVVSKVEGVSLEKAADVEEEYEGDGLMAWCRLTKWCTKIGGEGITEKRRYITAPAATKR